MKARMWMFPLVAAAASAQEPMPRSQQTLLVRKYCAVCHSDDHQNGGLTLEHFDAAHADPGVAAMLVSKLTSLAPSQVTGERQQDPAVLAMIARKMKTGAMGAAGIPVPDRFTQNALLAGLAESASRALDWTVDRQTSSVSASIVQEVAPSLGREDTNLYRLTVTCSQETREGKLQLSWAPGVPPDNQEMAIAADAKPPVKFKVESGEKAFKGAVGTMGTGAAILPATLPVRSLAIDGLFPGDKVTFPFARLPGAARRSLAACFPRAPAQ